MKKLGHIRIEQGSVIQNGQSIFHTPEMKVGRVCRAIYKNLDLDYPKFYKMSALSKLGFLAAEILLREVELSGYDAERIGISLANASSSLHTDRAYQDSMAEKPSPATFVYTLPNIVIGEICIRHGIHGEGVFFIEEEYRREGVLEHARMLLEEGVADLCLAGWLEVNMEGDYLADLDLLGG